MSSGQGSRESALMRHVPDFSALSSSKFHCFGLFCFVLCCGDRKKTKVWILLFSLRSPQRSPDGKLALHFDCRKKNNAQSSPRRVLFKRRLRGGKKRIRLNHHTRACLRLSNQKNTNAARASARLQRTSRVPGLPATTSCECSNWPDSPQRGSALEIH